MSDSTVQLGVTISDSSLKTELKRIQTLLNKNPVQLNIKINESSVKKQISSISAVMRKQLNQSYSVKVNANSTSVSSATSQTKNYINTLDSLIAVYKKAEGYADTFGKLKNVGRTSYNNSCLAFS